MTLNRSFIYFHKDQKSKGGVNEVGLKKLDSFTLETSKTTWSATFCATGVWGLTETTRQLCKNYETKKDAVYILKKSCRHIFCRDCIFELVEHELVCPECRIDFTKDDIVPDRKIRSLVTTLEFLCPYCKVCFIRYV